MKLIIEAENKEELKEALESIVPLIEEGYTQGQTCNGCYWNIEEPKTSENFMDIKEAFEIVYGLAEQSQLDGKDKELEEEAKKQALALDTVHDFLVNNVYN